MNRDILKGEWTQLKGRIRRQWGRISDDDIARINGDRELLLGRLQELYGRTREQAEEELERFMAEQEEPEPHVR